MQYLVLTHVSSFFQFNNMDSLPLYGLWFAAGMACGAAMRVMWWFRLYSCGQSCCKKRRPPPQDVSWVNHLSTSTSSASPAKSASRQSDAKKYGTGKSVGRSAASPKRTRAPTTAPIAPLPKPDVEHHPLELPSELLDMYETSVARRQSGNPFAH